MANDYAIWIITFFSSHHAVQAESLLKKEKLEVKLVPGPKDISPNCGIALLFRGEKLTAERILADKKVKIDGIFPYHEW